MSQANISVRESIRWLPGEASEPTSTLVLTSPLSAFVDIRVYKPSKAADGKCLDALNHLQWGFAGRSTTEKRHLPGHDEAINHTRWSHWVDSSKLLSDPEANDEGDMTDLGAGRTLEEGSMVNPDTNKLTQYEEIWIDVPLERVPGDNVMCVALRIEDVSRGIRGLIVRVGQFVQGVIREGEAFTAGRWEHDLRSQPSNNEDESYAFQGWDCTIMTGSLTLPWQAAVCRLPIAVGDPVTAGHDVWTVEEVVGW